MRLRIGRQWNGEPADDAEVAWVTLRENARGLHISIDSPHYGDPSPPMPSGPVPGLWEFEVVEVFIAGSGTPVPYTEVEISPGGHHLVLTLAGVRQQTAQLLPLNVVCTRISDRWAATATLDAQWLPPKPWRVNAAAIHGNGAARRYLTAAELSGPAPNFHQPDRFLPWSDED